MKAFFLSVLFLITAVLIISIFTKRIELTQIKESINSFKTFLPKAAESIRTLKQTIEKEVKEIGQETK